MNGSQMNDRATARRAEADAPADAGIFSLLHAAHALEDRVEKTLAAVGLSMPKYSVLSELVAAAVPLPLSELAARLSCVKSNMTQLVDRLEADGFVRRVDDPADRRSVRAAITEKGRERQAVAAAEVERLNETFAAAVDADDRAALYRLLAALG